MVPAVSSVEYPPIRFGENEIPGGVAHRLFTYICAEGSDCYNSRLVCKVFQNFIDEYILNPDRKPVCDSEARNLLNRYKHFPALNKLKKEISILKVCPTDHIELIHKVLKIQAKLICKARKEETSNSIKEFSSKKILIRDPEGLEKVAKEIFHYLGENLKGFGQSTDLVVDEMDEGNKIDCNLREPRTRSHLLHLFPKNWKEYFEPYPKHPSILYFLPDLTELSHVPLSPFLGRNTSLQKLGLDARGKLKSYQLSSISKLQNLRELALYNFKLDQLPESISQLKKLEILTLCSITKILDFSALKACSSLKKLELIFDPDDEKSNQVIGRLENIPIIELRLRRLTINEPDLLSKLNNIETLTLWECYLSLANNQQLLLPKNLKKLNLDNIKPSDCANIEELTLLEEYSFIKTSDEPVLNPIRWIETVRLKKQEDASISQSPEQSQPYLSKSKESLLRFAWDLFKAISLTLSLFLISCLKGRRSPN